MRRTLMEVVVALALLATSGSASAQGDAKRGEYLVEAGGCVGCHTENKKDAVPFAGGRELKTPFGTFYGPNITPHPQAGIGRWTEGDFVRAMREGNGPDGAHYFPAFPYPSFTKITDADLRDLFAYLRTLPPSQRPTQPHDLKFPFGFRFSLAGWKWLFFTPGAIRAGPEGVAAGQPRRLPRPGAGALRRVPHAAQFPRRPQAGPLPRRRKGARGQEHSEPHADPAQEVERRGAEGLPHDRTHARRRRRRRGDGRGRHQHDQQADAGGSRRADRVPAHAAAAPGGAQE